MGDVLSPQKAVQSPRLGRALPTPPSQVKSKGCLTSSLMQSNTRHFPRRYRNPSLPAQVSTCPPVPWAWFMSGP